MGNIFTESWSILLMDFSLSTEQTLIRDEVRRFAEAEMAPVSQEHDRNETYPYDVMKKAADMGLTGSHIPVEYGGMNKLIVAPYDKTIETLYKIRGNKLPTIHKPFKRSDRFNHVGDTFRELIDLWEENGLVKIIPSEDVHPWFNGKDNILLYDRPTYKWFMPANVEYRLGLFGNPNPPQDVNNNSAWIFWARRPRLLEKYSKNILSYEERDIGSEPRTREA